MRRRAAVLGICFAAWSTSARAADPSSPQGPPPPANPLAPPSAATPPSAASSPSAGSPPSAGSSPSAVTPSASPAASSLPAAVVPPSPTGTPGADQIQFAAREHDLGYRAYLDKQYDEAASHFENAFFAAPNPAELRSAIRARRDAGELARAATLAAIGQRRFPNDPATNKVAADVIALVRPHVYEVQIRSSAEYSVAIDEKIVAAERVKESRLFVTPGTHQLLVSWSEERNTHIAIEAKEGGEESLQLEPPSPPAVEAPPASAEVIAPPPTHDVPPEVPVARPPASKPFGPAVFIAGAALTTVGAGVTLWSGIDTIKNPGSEAVRQACSTGQASCHELYQTGHDSQVRTNVLVAVTSALGVATAAVGLFFTQWSQPALVTGSATGSNPVRQGVPSGLTVVPVVGIGITGVEGTF